MATADSPGLRLIAWQQLKVGFERALNGVPDAEAPDAALPASSAPPPFGFPWNIVLDDKARLRDDRAGLTLIPACSLFHPFPGETTVTVQQMPWQDGRWLELGIRHLPKLPRRAFNHLRKRCAQSDGEWAFSNESLLQVTLPLDATMQFAPSLPLAELADWVGEVIAVTLAGLAVVRGAPGKGRGQAGKK